MNAGRWLRGGLVGGVAAAVAILSAALWWFAGDRGAEAPGSGQEDKGEHPGRVFYEEHCAACHDTEEGIGPSLTPRVVEAYGSEEALEEYLRLTMPYGTPGSLGDGEYAAIAAYLRGREETSLDR